MATAAQVKAFIISIHAPARGATRDDKNDSGDTSISIHAPARGATVTSTPAKKSSSDFNPRSREGSDCNFFLWQQQDVLFQSTLPRGERLALTIKYTLQTIFQSTLPRGERHLYSMAIPMICDFNPRSREGSDMGKFKVGDHVKDFNPRSREGSD